MHRGTGEKTGASVRLRVKLHLGAINACGVVFPVLSSANPRDVDILAKFNLLGVGRELGSILYSEYIPFFPTTYQLVQLGLSGAGEWGRVFARQTG